MMAQETPPTKVAIIRFRPTTYPDVKTAVNEIQIVVGREIRHSSCEYPVRTSDLKLYGKSQIDVLNDYDAAAVFTFNGYQDALNFYIESVQNIRLAPYVYMLEPEPMENGASTAAAAASTSATSPHPPAGQSFEERSLVVFGILETVDADTARKEIEEKLKQKKSAVIVQCVLGPIHSAEIKDGPDRPCLIITMADAAEAPIVASVLLDGANQFTGHTLCTQMIRDSIVYLDPDLLREAAKVKHFKARDFLEHLVQKFGVRIDLEGEMKSEQRVKCSGHWIQIKQLEAYIHPNLALTAKSHETSQSAAQSSPQAASHTEPHASPQMAPQSVPHSTPQMPLDTPDVEMAEAGGQMNPSASSATRKTTVVRTTAPHQRPYSSSHSSGDADRSASTAYANGRKPRTSSSPSPSRTTSSPSSPASASHHGSSKSGRADKLQSSQSAGARPKEKTKKPIAVKKFVDTVPATEMHVFYLQRNSDILRPILKKIPDVSIEPDSTRGGFQVSAVTERDLARACSLLKDELQELEKKTEQYDLSDEKFSAESIREMMERLNKKFPDVIMKHDEQLQLLFICGEDAYSALVEVDAYLSAAKTSKTSKKDSVSEEIAVEKDIMNYILKVGKKGLMDFQKYNVKMNTTDTGDVVMCQFTGKKRDVSEAVEKMNKLVKKCTDSLTSENVLFTPTAYKSHHRPLDELEKQNQDKVLFCYSSDKTRLHLVGPQSAVQPIRESIESLLGTKRKRGSSLRRRKPKLAPDDTKTESDVDRLKADIARLSKTMGAAPSSTHTRRSPQKDTPKSYQYLSSNFIVHILQCDITNLSVDIVVNSSNSSLNHKHGVARCIAEKAGYALTQDCNKFVKTYGYLTLGSVFVSSAGNLPCRGVMHAASPVKLYVHHGPIQEVMQLLRTCLLEAASRKATSIAFPPIGAGVLGAPIDAVGLTFAEALALYFSTYPSSTIRNVYIVDITEQNITAIQQTFSAHINMKEIPYCGIAVPTASTAMTRPVTAQPTRTLPIKAVHHSDRPSTALSASSASSAGAPLFSTVVAAGFGALGHPGSAQPAARSTSVGPPSHTASSSSMTTHHPHFLPSSTPPASYPASSHSASASSMTSHSQTRSSASPSRSTPSPSSKPDDCVICMCPVTDPKQLPKCKHTFCRDCIDQMFAKMKPVCPVCGEIYGKITGDQPYGGTMTSRVDRYSRLPGYEAYGTIVIDYHIPSGKQGPNHSNPGAYYQGVSRTAYLPDNAEGQKVLRLLKEAFDARLMFTIGRSVTSGRENMVTWNDIHHKTSMHGGANNYGYPDPDYLKRVQEELAAKGIK